MKTALTRAAAPAVVLALAVARLVSGDPFTCSPRRDVEVPIVTEQARAVLNGLGVGDDVAGFAVARIVGPRDGEISIELRADGRGMRAWVTRRGGRPYPAPEHTERFDLFYGPPPPGSAVAEDAACIAVLRALAARIEAGGAQGL